jgi:hypothetical protein
VRKKWDRLNLLRVRRWARFAKYAAMLVLVVAFCLAGCGAHAYVVKMTECGRKTVESTVTVCAK